MELSYRDLLEGDWQEYEDAKIALGQDPNLFCCDQTWELDFLLGKMQTLYPYFDLATLRGAINSCFEELGSNQPRWFFIECLCRRLAIVIN